MNNFIFIDDHSALVRICGQLKESPWLAVDTEFERSNTYYPELCLLQVGNGGLTAVIDPLAITNPEPLYEVLYDQAITKVFHAARQDLEIFFHIKGELPVPLFDTQIAASLLGYDTQIGYANLVKEILGHDMPKTLTRSNWKRRPLSNSQLKYAADDVFYLGKIYELFHAELDRSGQLPLLREAFNSLARPELYQPDPENMWLKIRQAGKLKGEILNVLQRLAAWREITARAENRPRNWILHDNTLIEMARLLPAGPVDLSGIKGINKRILKRHGATLVEIIEMNRIQTD